MNGSTTAKNAARRDLVVVSVITLGLVALFHWLDVSESWPVWTHAFEDWEIDELPLSFATANLAFLWFAYRRWRAYQELNHDLAEEVERRAHVAEELRDSERRFKDFAASSSDWFWEMGPDLRFTFLSEQYEEISGVSLNRVVGRTSEEVGNRDPGDERWVKHHADLEAHRPFRNFEYAIIRNDGTPACFSASGQPVIDKDGAFRGYWGTGKDITERERAERALRESEEQFRNLIQGSIQGVLIHRDDEPLFANQVVADIFGFDGPEDIVALPTIEVLGAKHERLRLRAYGVARLRREASPERYEFEGVRKDGSPVWLENFVKVVVWHGERAIQSTLINITERKRAEQALRESEMRFRCVVDNSPFVIFVKDLEGGFRLVNKQFEEWYGVLAQDALGKASHDIFPNDYADAYVAQDQDVLRTEQPISREHEIPFEDGTIHLIIVTKFPIYNAHGDLIGVGTINADITDLKQSEAALIAAKVEAEFANRAKSEFLANMGHELRTPLNAIIGFAEVILDEKLGPVGCPEYRDYLKEINNAGQHLLRLIIDILDLSKIEAGKVNLHEESVDVGETIRSSLAMVGGRAEAGDLTLEQYTPKLLPQLYADERMLKQILVNLLSNAVKFTLAGGTVSIKAWIQPKDGYFFRISDTGIGMTLEDVPLSMTRFVQLESQLTRRHEGTGLGLPLSKSLVELHGGSLDLQSELGVGTTVTVCFPAERVVASSDNAGYLDVAHKAAS